MCSELLSNVAVESGGEEDTPSISASTASTAYSLIETSHVVFNKVKKLWNSNQESHREVRGDWMDICDCVTLLTPIHHRFVLYWQLRLRFVCQ